MSAWSKEGMSFVAKVTVQKAVEVLGRRPNEREVEMMAAALTKFFNTTRPNPSTYAGVSYRLH